MRSTLLRIAASLAVLVAPILGVPAAGHAATTTTVVPLTCSLFGGTLSGSIKLVVPLPDTVERGVNFPFVVTASDFFGIAAPYPGTITIHEGFSATSSATPSGPFTLNAPPHHFNQGDNDPGLGTLQSSFVASGAVGSTIQFSFLEFGYTIAPYDNPDNAFTATCTPTTSSPIVGSTNIVKAVPDAVRPTCVLTGHSGSAIQVTARDVGSGLRSIEVTKSTNANTTVAPFVFGTKSPVVISATKVNSGQPSQVALRVTDVKGNVVNCDPILTTLVREQRVQVFNDVPGVEHVVTVTNGDPGLKRVSVKVAGHRYSRTLRPGRTTTIDLAAMHPNETYRVVVRGFGKGAADVMIWDGQ